MDETERKQHAQNAVFADMQAAYSQPGHPGFHLTAPSHFTIDFWGPVHYNGYYHIMYHTCVNSGDFQQKTVFFHSKSKNLVDWEHLPVPIAPLEDELRMNDGCICINGSGQPVMLYTSVPKNGRIPRSHCAAVSDDEMLSFKRIEENPFMTLDNHGGPKFGGGWSDPFVFEAEGRTFMVVSKCVTAGGGDPLPIYEATDDTMLRWEYKGELFEHNGEVVNFFKLGSKWVLIYSPYSTIEYFVGDFDIENYRFIPETHNVLSFGYHSQENPIDRGFYASCIYNVESRKVLCGWISGFEDNEYWNGCMGVPRVLGLTGDLKLTQQPIEEIKTLRCEKVFEGKAKPFKAGCDMLDIEIELDIFDNCRFNLELKNAEEVLFFLEITENSFTVNGEVYDVCLSDCLENGKARILIDKTVAEIFLGDGSVCATRCFPYIGKNPTVFVEAQKGAEIVCYKMKECETSTLL